MNPFRHFYQSLKQSVKDLVNFPKSISRGVYMK